MLFQGHLDVIFQVELSLGVVIFGLKVHNKIILDGKYRVDGKMRVVIGVDLVDNSGVIRVCDHQMNMGRTHGGAVHEIEKNTGRPVGGQRVRSRMIAVPPEFALCVRNEFSAQVIFGLLWILKVVFPVGGGLPDIQHGSLDGFACLHIRDHAVHISDFTVGIGILNSTISELAEGSAGRPERTQDDVGRGRDTLFGNNFVGDFIDQPFFFPVRIIQLFTQTASMAKNLRLKANYITDSMALVTDGSADLAYGVDEFDSQHPLGRGEFNLAREVVDVFYQRPQNHASALGSLGSHCVDDARGEVGVKLTSGRHCCRYSSSTD